MQPILKINLSTQETSQYIVPADWIRAYVGGASLAARILYDEFTAHPAPLSQGAPLLFMAGPLTGTVGPSVSRSVVCARSPATGMWGESNIGGFWGAEMRFAGYDGIWITGAADAPVYLVITNNSVEFHEARKIWGLETYQTLEAIYSKHPNQRLRAAVIGPAGENLLPFSVIFTDHGRVAGRTGMGAVMGSKLLKAIAVLGGAKIPIAQPEIFMPLRSKSNLQIKDDPMTLYLRETGTAGAAEYFDYLGSMPKKYYQLGVFEGVDKVSGSTITDTILTRARACHGCVIACGRQVRLEGKDIPGLDRKGPEYETVVGFGPNLLNNDLASIVLMGEVCDRYGLDTISASNVIGLAFSIYEQGLFTPEQLDGLKLAWGDMNVVEKLLQKMVNREGLGALLADGARSLAHKVGHPDLAVEVNNLEVPYHDPRGVSGMALVYATSPRGACHNQSDYFVVDIGQLETSIGMQQYDRQGGAEKAKNVVIHQNWITVFNALVMCLFANVPPESIVGLVGSVDESLRGMDFSELMRCGERAWTLKRIINIRFGLTKSNDRIPVRFSTPYEDHPLGADGFVPDFPSMIDKYYRVRSWDPETGFPLPKKLVELGLEWVIKDLEHKNSEEP